MICAPCKRAGMHNQDAVALPPGLAGQVNLKQAVSLHASCEQPVTCPCHHRTGDYVRTEVRRG